MLTALPVLELLGYLDSLGSACLGVSESAAGHVKAESQGSAPNKVCFVVWHHDGRRENLTAGLDIAWVDYVC